VGNRNERVCSVANAKGGKTSKRRNERQKGKGDLRLDTRGNSPLVGACERNDEKEKGVKEKRRRWRGHQSLREPRRDVFRIRKRDPISGTRERTLRSCTVPGSRSCKEPEGRGISSASHRTVPRKKSEKENGAQ